MEAERADTVFARELRLVAHDLWIAQIIEAQIPWKTRLRMAFKLRQCACNISPLGEPLAPPLVVLRNGVELRQVERYESCRKRMRQSPCAVLDIAERASPGMHIWAAARCSRSSLAPQLCWADSREFVEEPLAQAILRRLVDRQRAEHGAQRMKQGATQSWKGGGSHQTLIRDSGNWDPIHPLASPS